MILFLPLILLVVILLIYHLTFKIKNPFWSHQPVVHNHSYFLKWNSPKIICDDFYMIKKKSTQALCFALRTCLIFLMHFFHHFCFLFKFCYFIYFLIENYIKFLFINFLFKIQFLFNF